MARLRPHLLLLGFSLLVLCDQPVTAGADPDLTYQGKSLNDWIAALKHKDARVSFRAAMVRRAGAPPPGAGAADSRC